MNTLETLQALIVRGIRELDLRREPAALYEPIAYTLGLGGKRLRPALCLLACDLVNGRVDDALAPAIGIEVFHNFTLLHDDIMDNAPIRRGKETVHVRWNPNAAILSGDTMMALAYEYVMKAPEHLRSEVFAVFNKTAIEVCEGQQYDMDFETAEDVSIADYLEMIRLKTAVLLAASLKIGAVIGGAAGNVAGELYRFGENIGIAFQLKDDLLDVFGDGDKFGKASGGDIVSNKKTFLYLKALEMADESERKELLMWFSGKHFEAVEKVAAVRSIYEKLHIRSLAEEQIERHYRAGMASLGRVPVDDTRKSELRRFAGQLKVRDH